MQALGVGEAPLQVAPPAPRPALGSSPPRGDAVELVLERAHVQASRRRDSAVCTPDLLFALLEVYDTLVDRALQLRGSSREELVERLDATGSAVEA